MKFEELKVWAVTFGLAALIIAATILILLYLPLPCNVHTAGLNASQIDKACNYSLDCTSC
jgi:hypothetical protein